MLIDNIQLTDQILEKHPDVNDINKILESQRESVKRIYGLIIDK